MDSTALLSMMILTCLGILVVAALAKPLRLLFRFCLSAIGGTALVFLCSKMGIAIGVNLITILTAGILGIPGVLGLILCSIVL